MDLPRRAISCGAGIAGVTFLAGLLTGAAFGPAFFGRPVAARAETTVAVASDTSWLRAGHAAEVVRVLDGDTFEARVHVWPGIDITTKVRLRGIDAPELRARCADERSKAEAARDALTAMLGDGDVMIVRVGLDKYGGRVLADAVTRTVPDVGGAMLASGLARPYGGGKRQSWCAGN